MTIFPVIKTEETVQVDDKLRIFANRSFLSKDEAEATLVEIEPDTGSGYIDVTGTSSDDWYLDWAYSTEGDKTISVRITTDGSPVTETKTISCVTEADDKLFSTDQQLFEIDYDILKYLPDGKNSWKYVHRIAQKEILEWLYTNGYTQYGGDRITKAEVLDVDEVSYWSRYIALRFIYHNLSNSIDDIFAQKARMYENWEHKWRTKASLKLDWNGDGTQGDLENRDMTTVRLIRK